LGWEGEDLMIMKRLLKMNVLYYYSAHPKYAQDLPSECYSFKVSAAQPYDTDKESHHMMGKGQTFLLFYVMYIPF
jgi:hypothetical protein